MLPRSDAVCSSLLRGGNWAGALVDLAKVSLLMTDVAESTAAVESSCEQVEVGSRFRMRLADASSSRDRRQLQGGNVHIRSGDGSILDATFDVTDQGDGSWIMSYESSGGRAGGPNPRNLDYRIALSLIFDRMKQIGITIREIRVETQQTAKLSTDERQVQLDSHSLPLHMNRVRNTEELRKDISRNARRVGTKNKRAKEEAVAAWSS